MPPRIISQSRAKLALYTAGSAGFAVLFVWMLFQPHASQWRAFLGWLGVGLFGVGAVVFGARTVRPQTLALDAEGFTIGGGLTMQPRRHAWRDIERFFIYRGYRGVKIIGFNYLPGRAPNVALAAGSRPFGADAALAKGWTLSPEALVAVLNEYRTAAH